MGKKASAGAVAVSVSTLLLAAAIAVAAAGFVSCAKKEAASAVALTVNGQAITAADVDKAAEFFRQQQVVAAQIFESGGDAYVRRAAARQLAANLLLLAETKRLGWQANPVLVGSAVEHYIAQFPNREVFLSQLAAMGESEESMRRGMEEEYLLDSLLSMVSSTAEPASDEECRAHYDANTERYKESERARTSHIIFGLEPTAADSQVRVVMEKAKEAAAKARGGADFDALIKEYSPGAGGDIGWVKKGDLFPDLDRKIFSMKKGDVSDPVPSGMGIHIIKKTDEKEARQMSYEDAAAGIKAALAERKKAERVNAYVDSLIGAADVKYMDTTLVMRDTAR